MYINKSSKNLCGLVGSMTLLIVLTAGSASARITKGPFLLRVYQNRAAVMWENDTAGPGKLFYGEANCLKNQVLTQPIRVDYKSTGRYEPIGQRTFFIHKTWMENLRPGTVYSYRTDEAPGQTHSFRTQPKKTDEARFIVYGDSRSYPQIHRKLIELMMAERVDFIIHNGDLVNQGASYEQWGPEFFEPMKGLAESIPVYAVKGGHDNSAANWSPGPPNYFDKLLMPPGQQHNYSFDYGGVHFACADNYHGPFPADPQPVLNWISADMAKSDKMWKFVVMHEPSLNFGGHWTMWGYPKALPTYSRLGVDFVIVGSSHMHERFRPVVPPSGSDGSYVTYVTAAGGGAPLYDVEPTIYHGRAKKEYSFCLFHIKGNKLTMDAINIDGMIIDHLQITKTDGQVNKEYKQTAVPLEAIRIHQNLHRAFAGTQLPGNIMPNKPFNVTFKVTIPPLDHSAKMTFKLCANADKYKLSEPKTITVPERGGAFEVDFTATPLADVKITEDPGGKPKTIEPPLLIDCHYEIGDIHWDINQRL
ncbi:MAG TPA: metallophosphoesterase family protein [Sedimentisphaerales bacterium]|nr:metallophosphoesterase family protein [Sedimentisphaerales bacterium]